MRFPQQLIPANFCQKLAVQRVGGFFAVTSRLGAGTEFVITLPYELPAVLAEPAAQLHTKDGISV